MGIAAPAGDVFVFRDRSLIWVDQKSNGRIAARATFLPICNTPTPRCRRVLAMRDRKVESVPGSHNENQECERQALKITSLEPQAGLAWLGGHRRDGAAVRNRWKLQRRLARNPIAFAVEYVPAWRVRRRVGDKPAATVARGQCPRAARARRRVRARRAPRARGTCEMNARALARHYRACGLASISLRNQGKR